MVDLSLCILSVCISVTRFSIQRLKDLMWVCFCFKESYVLWAGFEGHKASLI